MKKMILILLMLSLADIAHAGDFQLSVKQGFLYGYEDKAIKNLTTLETLKTRPVEGWGKWNVLWDGWSLDAGFAYDADHINTGALLLGREFGTLGKYFPIDFPLKDAFVITVYPIGIRADDLFSTPNLQLCSGGAFVKATLKF